MSPEVGKLAYRAIINYLGGQKDRYVHLIRKAMLLNGFLTCPHCHSLMVTCRVGLKIKSDAILCTSCGYLEKKEEEMVC
jgi:transcription elongation factor Elf1